MHNQKICSAMSKNEKSFGLRNIAEKQEIIKSGLPTFLMKTKVCFKSDSMNRLIGYVKMYQQ